MVVTAAVMEVTVATAAVIMEVTVEVTTEATPTMLAVTTLAGTAEAGILVAADATGMGAGGRMAWAHAGV